MYGPTVGMWGWPREVGPDTFSVCVMGVQTGRKELIDPPHTRIYQGVWVGCLFSRLSATFTQTELVCAPYIRKQWHLTFMWHSLICSSAVPCSTLMIDSSKQITFDDEIFRNRSAWFMLSLFNNGNLLNKSTRLNPVLRHMQ